MLAWNGLLPLQRLLGPRTVELRSADNDTRITADAIVSRFQEDRLIVLKYDFLGFQDGILSDRILLPSKAYILPAEHFPSRIPAKSQPMFSATSKGRRASTTCGTHSALALSSDSSADDPVTRFGENRLSTPFTQRHNAAQRRITLPSQCILGSRSYQSYAVSGEYPEMRRGCEDKLPANLRRSTGIVNFVRGM